MDERRLESVPLFAKLRAQERQFIARLAEEVEVPAGEELATEGRFAHEFFVIEEGSAEVRHEGETISTLGPGDFFGEIALVQTGRRTATVVATSAMRLMVLSEGSFATVRGEIPEIVGHIRTAVDERMTAARHR